QSALPLIADNLTIQGPGADQLEVHRSATTRFRLFDVSKTVTISGLTLSNGDAGQGRGGAVQSQQTLTLDHCVLKGNTADTGGAFSNNGTATVTACTFSANVANLDGGAIGNGRGPLTVRDSTFSANQAHRDGGAINNLSTLTVSNCTFSANLADGR